MNRAEAKDVFLNRGFIDGIYDGDKWREACIVISEWLEQEPFINKPCVSSGVCEHDKQKMLEKIRAEIKGWQVDIHDNEYDADKHDFVFERIFEIIDEYKAESEVDNGNNNH